jgi:hypothetical protein
MSLAALVLLAAGASEVPICADRPGKATAVCTVPAGRFQLETSIFDWTRTEGSGVTAKVLTIGSPVLKYGLDDRSDIEFGFSPFVWAETDGASVSGIGDVTVRYKRRLTGDDAAVQWALVPFVKLPTARHSIGNGKVEGGLAVPISFALGGGVGATLGPEVDLLADSDGHGRHASLVNLISLSATVAPRLTLSGDLWSNFNFDPAGTVKQASVDAAVAYGISNSMQLDGGVNLGLTRDTADVELYAGVSVRF